MLSRNLATLDPATPTGERMEKYRALVDALDIVVVTAGNYLRLFFYRTSVEPDLVTAQDPFETGLLALVLARRFGAKLELQIHTDLLSPAFAAESLKNRIRIRLARLLLPRADCIRVVSRRIADSLRTSHFALGTDPVVLPIYIQPSALSGAPIDLRHNYPQFTSIFLMASRLAKEKNIDLAIEAMADIVRTHPRAGLVIVGSGPELEHLQLLVSRLQLGDNVVFEPWTDSIASYYKTADCFLLTSNYEGYGLSLVEAALAHCPIITTDVGVVHDLITAEHALIVPVGDKVRLVRQMRFILDDPKWHKEVRERLARVADEIMSERDYLEALKRSWVTCGTLR